MLKEVRKEMFLRYTMAYFVAFSVIGAVCWYIIIFTASFGWKVSWAWWWSGCMAALMNFVVYDAIISLVTWLMCNTCSRFGKLVYHVRSVKIGHEED